MPLICPAMLPYVLLYMWMTDYTKYDNNDDDDNDDDNDDVI